MTTKQFDFIIKKLMNIENKINNLKLSSKESVTPLRKADFKYIPIQEIFDNKICSKPTFYKYLKTGEYSLYKYGNKSFVNLEEFLNAFQKAK